jgi:hypothetical protein
MADNLNLTRGLIIVENEVATKIIQKAIQLTQHTLIVEGSTLQK